MNLLLSEFFDILNKQKDDTDRCNLLKQHDSDVVRTYLNLNFNPGVKWLLPEGSPPYKKEEDKPIGYQQTTLQNELKRLYIFFDPNQRLKPIKRESLFIDVLEGLHYTEADLLLLIKEKKLTEKYKNITESIVRMVFPNLLPAKAKKVVKKGGRKKKTK